LKLWKGNGGWDTIARRDCSDRKTSFVTIFFLKMEQIPREVALFKLFVDFYISVVDEFYVDSKVMHSAEK
jgi:hypothetical protein